MRKLWVGRQPAKAVEQSCVPTGQAALSPLSYASGTDAARLEGEGRPDEAGFDELASFVVRQKVLHQEVVPASMRVIQAALSTIDSQWSMVRQQQQSKPGLGVCGLPQNRMGACPDAPTWYEMHSREEPPGRTECVNRKASSRSISLCERESEIERAR